jgi:hypothetical protein
VSNCPKQAIATERIANFEERVLKSDKSSFSFKKILLKCFMALCIGTAGLFVGYAFLLPLEPEEIASTGHGMVRDTGATAPQYVAQIEPNNLVSPIDIVDILKANPALLCPVKTASSIGSIGNSAENINSGSSGSMLDLVGLNYVCPGRVVIQR